MRSYLKQLVTLVTLILLTNCDPKDDAPEGNDPVIYFPPATTSWETVNTAELAWNEEAIATLSEYLATTNTKAFILLKDGKIAIEEYFQDTSPTDNLPWFSAAKTFTALLTGIAEEEGLLSIREASNNHLDLAWTSLTLEQESSIQIINHLTMTTGLDDRVADPNCTDPDCLKFLTTPNNRWAYHNGPYTKLGDVIASVSGESYNNFTANRVLDKVGMQGTWLKFGFNNIFVSNARSMARFGLLLLNKGTWQDDPILSNDAYFSAMTNSTQSLNPAYGYLTWLNGKSSFKIPGLQTSFNGSITPNAPPDMFAAMGRNGQLINVVPSLGVVMIRMGDNPQNDLVPFTYQDELWKRLIDIF
ncbi:hypothetical protein BFP97_06890 [Roseivirga sp. 4D4]|uniref:serine hydrolase domain-containing protein n=1 Tax=Roseivirga sp. 4D4 TaxID=1889784 RepID=UPI000853DB60|nr:serine hydrolase [Roseivirga sp. 4D4]OEK01253.1 hypothetical protein BFP97_06890 [Roseivirga sp. 4D4]